MAIDLGDVRTGVAICDKLEMLAVPLCTIYQPDLKMLLTEIVILVKENTAELLVLGIPKHLNSMDGVRAQKSTSFAKLLKDASGLPVVLWDERLTTVLANRLLTSNDKCGKKRKKLVDVVTAVLILESYLEFRKNQANSEG
ncbi:MAG: Holliday junction resolvase RuvX [Oscillospiraceae bacterium]|jgi:putative Holliday junction resolvase|nr:Holliday junction resolvase RuvX [Oscillospiraceae bacterium]